MTNFQRGWPEEWTPGGGGGWVGPGRVVHLGGAAMPVYMPRGDALWLVGFWATLAAVAGLVVGLVVGVMA